MLEWQHSGDRQGQEDVKPCTQNVFAMLAFSPTHKSHITNMILASLSRLGCTTGIAGHSESECATDKQAQLNISDGGALLSHAQGGRDVR